jgi:hypothetical protein
MNERRFSGSRFGRPNGRSEGGTPPGALAAAIVFPAAKSAYPGTTRLRTFDLAHRWCYSVDGHRDRIPSMVEIKDSGAEFHWSRPRIVGLVFSAVASPIFFVFSGFGQATLGGIIWFAACIGLTIAYVRSTRFRTFMQRLVPTTAEKAERRRLERD